jgi:4'-phosphopantetheinyl transferase EntD
LSAALLPTLLAGLPVVTEEMRLSALVAPAHAQDLHETAGMADRRRLEYLAGRHCARVALARLGVHGHVLRAGPDRAPIWPPGIVGSITHAGAAPDGFCGVAVARGGDLRSIGIDAEPDRPLPDDLLPTVLTPAERDALAGRPAAQRARIATVYFSAKESVYKALSPLLGIFLDFHDVSIELDLGLDAAAGAGRFTADVQAPVPATAQIPPLAGRVLVAGDLVLTAAIAASRP